MKRLEYNIYDFYGEDLDFVGLIKITDFTDPERRIHSLLHLGEFYPIVRDNNDEDYFYIIDEEFNYDDAWSIDIDEITEKISLEEIERTLGKGIKFEFHPVDSEKIKWYNTEYLCGAGDDILRLTVDFEENEYEVTLI